jgi:hypothetical protein
MKGHLLQGNFAYIAKSKIFVLQSYCFTQILGNL